MTRNKPKKRNLNILFLLPLIIYVLFIFKTQFTLHNESYFTLIDDAMISMRYAENLADGNGFVYNIGEYVQGYTNLGWTLWMALMHLIVNNPSFLIMLSSAITLTGLLYVVYKTTEFLKGNVLIAVILTGLYYPLVFWSLRGMESGIIALLIYLILYCVLKDTESWKIGLLASLLIIIRIDNAPMLLVLFLFYRKAYWYPIIALAGVLLFQHLYYGSIFPNTYTLKIGGSTLTERVGAGLEMFKTNALRDFIVVPFAVLAVLKNKRLYILFALFITQCLYSIYIGGDYAEGQITSANRFVILGMPSIFILGSIYITRLKLNKTMSVIIGLLVMLLSNGMTWLSDVPMLDSDTKRTEVGVYLNKTTLKTTTIGAHAIGNIGYYSKRKIIDLLGKVDPTIANSKPQGKFIPGHNKWDYNYSIMELKPDIIVPAWQKDIIVYLKQGYINKGTIYYKK